MKYKLRFVCAHCGAVSTTESYEFVDSIFLRACFGCEICHLEGNIDDFLMLNAETEVNPSLYYRVVPYGMTGAGEFLFLLGGPNLNNYTQH